MAQPFLAAGENRFVVAAVEIDHPVGGQPGLGERRGEQVRPGGAPEHAACGARGDAGGEQGGGRAIDRTVAAAGDLVKPAEHEAAARQARIQGSHAERQDLLEMPSACLDLFDPGAQGVEGGLWAHNSL